jgi:hypothetical protein
MEKGPSGFIQCPHCNCKYKTDVKYQKHLTDKHANCSATVALNSIAIAAAAAQQQQQECCVCLDTLNESYMLYPCGHAQYCEACARKSNTCSLCRKEIQDVVKVYL